MKRQCRRAAALLPLLLAHGVVHAEPRIYRLTATHSFVHFELDHRGLSTRRGRFDRCEGEVELDRVARRGHGEVRVHLDSVDTGSATLDQALKSTLGVAAAPLAVLRVDTLRFDGDTVVAASGQLALGGRSGALTLQAARFNCYFSPLLRREVCGGDFEATLDPAAWGLDLPAGLGPALRLHVQVEAAQP